MSKYPPPRGYGQAAPDYQLIYPPHDNIYPPPRGYGQPTPDYQLIYPPHNNNAAVDVGRDPYELYNWQVIEPGSSRGARSAGFGAGTVARLGDEPKSFYEHGTIGATSYAPTQSRGSERYQAYGHGSQDHDGRHHGGSYESDAHDRTSHKEGKRRAYDTSTSQHPRHHDSGRNGGHRGHDNDEQLIRDQMLAMSLQHQEDEYVSGTVLKEPSRHHGRDHFPLGSSREYSKDPRSRAHRHEYYKQSTSSSAHQGHGGRHRGHEGVSDPYLDRYEMSPSKTQVHHGGGSKSLVMKEPCGVCLDEYPVTYLYKLCPRDSSICLLYCASCTKRWFKSTMKSMPKQPIMCCKASVSIDPVAHLFRPGFVKEYMAIKMEFDTVDKLYCSYKKCSAFIPPPSIKGKHATCQECGRQTCTRCKNAAHRGKPCSSNPEDEGLKELGHRKGWQQCPGCGNLTSRQGGCLHIKCTICGTDWCYNCGRKECDTTFCVAERNDYPFDD